MGILLGLGAVWVLVYLLGAPAQLATLAVIVGAIALIGSAFRKHGLAGGLGRGGSSVFRWVLKQAAGVLKGVIAGPLALLDEEGKRWVRIVVTTVLLWGASWVALHLLGWAPRVLVVLLLLNLLWARSVYRAATASLRNSAAAAKRRKAEKDFRDRIDQLPARVQQLQHQAVGGARAALGRGMPLERLAAIRSKYPDDKDVQRWMKEETAAMEWNQPGAAFEPVIPGVGKASRWTVGRGRRFGGRFRDGWRNKPRQDEEGSS